MVLRQVSAAWLLLLFTPSACQAQGEGKQACPQPSRASLVAKQPGSGIKLPELTGRVVDNASILSSASERILAGLSADLEARRTDQMVVVTLPSLHGRRIEEVGLALGRGWGVGQRGKDNGVLLIVAPTERKVRIEVGYGLQAALTNSEAMSIMDEVMVPRFSRGKLEDATVAGAEAIKAELDRSPLVEACQ